MNPRHADPTTPDTKVRPAFWTSKRRIGNFFLFGVAVWAATTLALPRPSASDSSGPNRRASSAAFVAASQSKRHDLPLHRVAANDAPPTDIASIRAFCGDCHPMPDPTHLPAGYWPQQVLDKIALYHQSRRNDLVIPDYQAIVDYFVKDAPPGYQFPPPVKSLDTTFQAVPLRWDGEKDLMAVSSTLPLADKRTPEDAISMAVTDLWTGVIKRLEFHRSESGEASKVDVTSTLLGRGGNPSRIHEADLDADGIMDYVVSDLGSMAPQDERQGSVWWLQGQSDGGFRRHALRLGLTRVADALPFDYDGDGDLDLIIADFGLYFSGGVEIMRQTGIQNGIPQFETEVLDPRDGCIEILIADFNDDGLDDLITLVTQNAESIDLYLNRGDGQLERKNLHTGNTPTLGSSGIEVVDLDKDGDLDVVYTCGDTFDDNMAKPFHHIGWLENEGTFPLTPHELFPMPGVYTATVGDIDQDGDLDIAACSLLSQHQVDAYPPGSFPSVVWLEQTEDMEFAPHVLETDRCHAATCRLIDIDRDGDLDLYVPPLTVEMTPQTEYVWWMNRTIDGPVPSDESAEPAAAQ
ncbi:FG-GAP repeat domain-containing protein [Crateriforma spongiae]|uniref:FG-GAP repeat domain-containing protein n=1 Tax=Crateriforma spongiae TaxID=2724528 RepID=UPI001446721F|nr:VCBS repeat-containing protein [Crateriforma spongiae]